MAKYHVVNGVHFQQTALLKHAMDIRDRYADGEPITGDDASLLKTLFQRHPEYDVKSGPGVAYFTVGTNYTGKPTRCFYVMRTDGLLVDFSVKTCLVGAPTFEQELRAALRHAIVGQIDMFRLEHWRANQQQYICEASQRILLLDDVHVHHQPPNDFLSLTKQWLITRQKNRLPAPCDNDLSDKSLREGAAELINVAMQGEWQLFHYQHAQLQLLDKHLHLRLKRKAA